MILIACFTRPTDFEEYLLILASDLILVVCRARENPDPPPRGTRHLRRNVWESHPSHSIKNRRPGQ